MTQTRPFRLFISYAHEDDRFRRELETHLSLLKRQGILEVWSDRQIDAGQNWEQSIRDNLETADIILLLISPDFLASDFCYHKELQRAMERHEAREAQVIPVFLRSCDWKGAVFGSLQGVPDNARPIAKWGDRDEAFTIVAEAIRKAAESLKLAATKPVAAPAARAVPEPDRQEGPAAGRRPPGERSIPNAGRTVSGAAEERAQRPRRPAKAIAAAGLLLLSLGVAAAFVLVALRDAVPPAPAVGTDRAARPDPAAPDAEPSAAAPASAPAPVVAPAKPSPAPLRPGQTFLRDCPDCPEMVLIPAGSFTMGSPASETERFDNEGPVRQVTIARPFALGRTEVTRAQYAAFATTTGHDGATGCLVWSGSRWQWDPTATWQNPGYPQRDADPVLCVSWDDAQAYAAWLSERTGGTYHLPSEAQWEYAARAGTTLARYWGAEPDAACSPAAPAGAAGLAGFADWSDVARCRNEGHRATPAGRFRPNAFGLSYMLGNVWQWTADCYAPSYADAPADGSPRSTAGCLERVLRGGAWSGSTRYVRSAARSSDAPDVRSGYIGFRVAKVIPE